MDARQQLNDLSVATRRALTKAITFDPHSQTYGCRISETRLTSTGTYQEFVIAEVRGQPDKTTAEVAASAYAVHALNADIVRVATAVYR